jgi:VWFA-related protein
MRFSILPTVVLSLVAASPYQAPAGEGQPEISSQEAPVTFSERVNLVSVPVVVRGREGHAVGNLRQEDFQLFDKGKLQTITKFTVEKTEVAAPAPTGSAAAAAAGRTTATTPTPVPSPPVTFPERYVAFLFDDVQMPIDDLARARTAAIRMVNESLDPGTRAAIYTTSGRVMLDFTGDREKLAQALDRIKPFPTITGIQLDCPSVSYYQALRIVDFGDQEALLSGQIDYLVKCDPPSPRDDLGFDLEMAKPIVKMMANRALGLGGQAVRDDLNLLKELVRRLTAMPGSRAIILVSPGFFLPDDRRHDEETDVMDWAIRANVVISSLDTRIIMAMTPRGDADVPIILGEIEHVRQEFEQKRAYADEGVMQELADGTGGTFFHNDNDLKAGFDQLAARPEIIYLLGFSPQNLKPDGSYHGLKVTVRNVSSPTVQARRGYWAPNHAMDTAEAAKEELREDVFSREEIRGIPVDLHTEFFKSSEDKAELTVTALLNPDSLRFQKAAERNNDTVTVVTGVFDGNGNYVAGIQRVVQLHLRDQTLTALRSAGISVEETFTVRPGRYLVRLVVQDAGGQTTAARNEGVEIP